jgi:hypothetical protein
MGWTAATTFVAEVLSKGYAPRSGLLECSGTHCLCWLEERLLGAVDAPQSPPYHETHGSPDAEPSGDTPKSGIQSTELSDAVAQSDETGPKTESPSLYELKKESPSGNPSPSALDTSTQAEIQSRSGEIPSAPADEVTTQETEADLRLPLALAGLSAWLGSRREPALRDAASFLYFQAQAQARSAPPDPEVVALWDRKEQWLARRLRVTEAEAARAFRAAEGLEPFRISGQQVSWQLTRWEEPRLSRYPELERILVKVG